LEECNGSTSSFDYNLTLDTKKEISMLQRTEKGKEDSILLNYTRFIDNFNIVLKRIKTLAHF
jgi:phage anti-repressor protein